MFDIYLPVAEITVAAPLFLALAFIVGMLSGALGVGGGFLVTPLMIALGAPAAVAVGSASGQVFASSYASITAASRRKIIDYKLAFFMLSSGLFGAGVGVLLFKGLADSGNAESFIKMCFTILLISVGVLMFRGAPASASAKQPQASLINPDIRAPGRIMRLLAWRRIYFPRSRVKIGVPALMLTGGVIGLISGFLGIGGGFLTVPALIYLLRVPISTAASTSQAQVMILSLFALFSHALLNHNVDFLLSVVLIVGGAPGARIGARLASKVPGDKLRPVFSIVMLGTALFLLSELLTPSEFDFTVREMS